MGYLRPSICSRVVQNAGRVLLSGVSLGITQRIDGGRCLDAITRVWLGIYSALKVGKVEYIITYDPAQLSPEWSYWDLVSVSICFGRDSLLGSSSVVRVPVCDSDT